MAARGYQLNFNQDFTSVSVLGCGNNGGFRIFSINATDKVEEIYARDVEEIKLIERLFNSSLVVMVPLKKPNCLQMLHFKKKQVICNCVYPTDILSVRMNRTRLVVCLVENIHIHDIRDMKILYSIVNIAPNELGLCSLSLNSQVAYPVSSTSGELRTYNASKLRDGLIIKAHNSKLSALCYSANGQLIATASMRGTVIRVFCARNGQRLQEFRRGVKRCVNIGSLAFSVEGEYLCVSSNTETVHVFKIDLQALKGMENLDNLEQLKELSAKALEEAKKEQNSERQVAVHAQRHAELEAATTAAAANSNSGWSDYLSKAVSSYLIPTQVTDVLAQDRAFATAVLVQPGPRHQCAVARVHKDLKLLVASDDGFLYIHEFNEETGGVCKLETVHDLRCVLDDIIELSLSENSDKSSTNSPVKSKESSATTNYAIPTITIGATATCTSNNANGSKSDKPGKMNTTNSSATARGSCNNKHSVAPFYIQSPDLSPDNSYASILKGGQANGLTDSAKFRNLCDAIDTPAKLYDELQFPPVAIAARD